MNILFVLIVALISVFAIAMGLFGLVAPTRLFRWVMIWGSKPGLWTAVVARLVFGISLWYAAPQSRLPVTMRVLGVLIVVAAGVLSFMGVERFKALLDWVCRLPASLRRLWGALAIAAGVFFMWAVVIA